METEESLAREYELSPNHEIRSGYQAAVTAFRAALDGAQRLGGTDNSALVIRLPSVHDLYYGAVLRLSAAVDWGDKASAAPRQLHHDAYTTL